MNAEMVKGRILTRREQRTIIERMVISPTRSSEMDIDSIMNPINYANVYVSSVKNAIEIIPICTEGCA